MSVLPCDQHGSIVPGKLLGLYPAMFSRQVRYTSYRRLCYDCMQTLLSAHNKDWVEKNTDTQAMLNGGCSSCHAELTTPDQINQFWCTAYVRTDVRKDYQAQYCDDCAHMLQDQLKLKVHNV
jgi:hypothetical protein